MMADTDDTRTEFWLKLKQPYLSEQPWFVLPSLEYNLFDPYLEHVADNPELLIERLYNLFIEGIFELQPGEPDQHGVIERIKNSTENVLQPKEAHKAVLSKSQHEELFKPDNTTHVENAIIDLKNAIAKLDTESEAYSKGVEILNFLAKE
jgi:hypothetical protein